MKKIKQHMQTYEFRFFLTVTALFLGMSTPAFADLTSNIQDIQSKISAICTPLAIIFLIIAGWQKAMGNSQIFVLALIGTIIMFGAPQIVSFISTSFGN
jgi:type IV secretory pathway VirB2 component (pilin)